MRLQKIPDEQQQMYIEQHERTSDATIQQVVIRGTLLAVHAEFVTIRAILDGPIVGVQQQELIRKRMQRITQYSEQLAKYMGEFAAIETICKINLQVLRQAQAEKGGVPCLKKR